MKTLQKKMRVKVAIPSPKWMLMIGGFFLRTEPELILKSRFVYPDRLLKSGFVFTYDNIESAIDELK